MVQLWHYFEKQDQAHTATFRARRAEIKIKGDIVPGLADYTVMFDPAKVLEFTTSTVKVANQDPAATDPKKPESVSVKQPASAVSVLQDVSATLHSTYADFTMGQFKTPISWEGVNSSGKLLFAERSMSSRQFGDKRDLGVQVSKTFDNFSYALGLFNGSGLNALDSDTSKDLALRLEAYPVKGLTVAAAALSTIVDRSVAGAKDRYEVDLRYENGGFLAQGEFIMAKDKISPSMLLDTTLIRDINASAGGYAAFAYSLKDMLRAGDVLQPCLRVGRFNPHSDMAIAKGTTLYNLGQVSHLEAGVNWLIKGHDAKLQLNVGHFAYEYPTVELAVQTVTLALQMAL